MILTHREDGPCIIERNNQGIINSEHWFKNGISKMKNINMKSLDNIYYVLGLIFKIYLLHK